MDARMPIDLRRLFSYLFHRLHGAVPLPAPVMDNHKVIAAVTVGGLCHPTRTVPLREFVELAAVHTAARIAFCLK